MRLSRLSFAWKIALALTGLAVLVWALWEWTSSSFLDAWAPNIATAAVTVALTITVVDAILRKEAQRRLEPRLYLVRFWIGAALQRFVWTVAVDYAETRLATARPIPNDSIALMNQWIEDASDDDPQPLRGEKYPLLFESGMALADALSKHVEPERDHLPSELVVAVRSLSQQVEEGEILARSPAAEKIACGNIVAAALYVARTLRRSGAHEWFDVGPTAKVEEERRQELIRGRPMRQAPGAQD